jgi:hypothetical protein
MPTQLLYRAIGQAYALTCGVSASAAVTVTNAPAQNIQAVALINSTSTPCAVTFNSLQNATVPAGFRFPTQNNPSVASCIILGSNMTQPIVAAVPAGGFNAFGIAQGTGNPVIQMFPVELQS